MTLSFEALLAMAEEFLRDPAPRLAQLLRNRPELSPAPTVPLHKLEHCFLALGLMSACIPQVHTACTASACPLERLQAIIDAAQVLLHPYLGIGGDASPVLQ